MNVSESTEEERHLVYVGITRAQRELTYNYCEEQQRQGKTLLV